MAKLFLFRHAQTPDNVNHTFSGKRDPELTPSGIEEAKKIQKELINEKVTKGYTATNQRSKHTLEIVLEPHEGTELVVADPRVRERDYGELTGKNKDRIADLHPKQFKIWHRSYDVPPPGGESIKQVEVRVLEFLKEVIANVRHGDVIFMCTSGNSLRPIRRHFEKMTIEEMMGFEHERGHIYEYEI